MRRHFKSLIIIGILVHFVLECYAQTRGSGVAAIANAPAENATGTNTLGPDISRAIRQCRLDLVHQHTSGFVNVISAMRPGVSGELWHYLSRTNAVEFLNDLVDGKIKSYDGRQYKDFHDAVLVIIDPGKRVLFNKEYFDSYVGGLCCLPLGNEANIVVIDLTKFIDADKKLVRDALITKLAPKLKGQKDDDGKPIDLPSLLAERQVNTIGLIALDASKPAELTPIHSVDVRYGEKVQGLMDKAAATYGKWKEADAAFERRQKEISWLITTKEPDLERGIEELIDGKGVPSHVSSEKLPHALLLIMDTANRTWVTVLHGPTARSGAEVLRHGKQAHVVLLDMTNFTEEEKASTREFLVRKLGKQIDAGKGADGESLDFASHLTTWAGTAVLLFAEDDSKPGALSPILDWDVHFKEKIDLLEARGRTAYEAWKLNDKRQK